MRIVLVSSLYCLIVFLSSACNEAKPPVQATTPVPEAFHASYGKDVVQELSSARFNSRNNLIDELYSEVLENDPELENLENEINNVSNVLAEGTKEYDTYLANHQRFMTDANRFLQYMQDSTLKANTLELLSCFQDDFASRTNNLTEKNNQLDSINIDIQDHHKLLKFLLAMSSMTQYEQEHLPHSDPLLQTEKSLVNVKNQIDARTEL